MSKKIVVQIPIASDFEDSFNNAVDEGEEITKEDRTRFNEITDKVRTRFGDVALIVDLDAGTVELYRKS
jgi:hypothetical protein